MKSIVTSENHKFNIDLSLLQKKEQEELLLFYQYLLFKSGQRLRWIPGNEKTESAKLPETFYTPVQVKAYYKFDRDEIYTNR